MEAGQDMEQQQAMANGRAVVRRSEEEILRHLEEQERSGFTIKEYCEVSDIVEQTFYSWVKKYRPRPEEAAGFAAIEVVAEDRRPRLFAEVGSIRLYQEVSPEYLKSLLV